MFCETCRDVEDAAQGWRLMRRAGDAWEDPVLDVRDEALRESARAGKRPRSADGDRLAMPCRLCAASALDIPVVQSHS